MKIKNSTSNTVSWFCFNHLDALKLIALGSGDLAKNKEESYTPPDNLDGFYGVRFTLQGGGQELAVGTISKNATITLVEGDGGTYYVDAN